MKKIYGSFIVFTLAVILITFPVAKAAAAREGQAKSTEAIGESQLNSSNVSLLNNLMLSKMNDLRSSVGVGPLSIDATLNSYAATRSVEATTKWSHTRPNGSQGCDMIPPNKWRGENLSYVTFPDFGYSQEEQQQAAEVMFDNLVASPTHYDNMTFGSFTKVGIRTNVANTADGTRLTTAYLFSN
ncbi:MAG: CAP domain-containing protein [Lachnospiraceae bacterium]|nr:CAP domain-containing protein [Lachnospiraceae bacterium]MBQ9605656.1 CAP domain-containing protein [Lachnospiraceae bacterium]MBR1524106.1 CAP domain-containing protein [Lachnospiraceae bacterium]